MQGKVHKKNTQVSEEKINLHVFMENETQHTGKKTQM